MSDVQYKLDYDDGAARRSERKWFTRLRRVLKRNSANANFRIPAAANTAITVIICGGVFFAAVRFAPEGYRPQDFTGEYIGDVAGEVKENEGAVDAEVQAYVNAVRAAYEQRNAQYARIVEGYLEAYKAAVALNQLQVEANNRLRGAYVERQMGQSAQASGANVGLANGAEALGTVLNWLEPGPVTLFSRKRNVNAASRAVVSKMRLSRAPMSISLAM
ncbi:MAG: hypothetical protein IPM67_05275 [Sphingomonadales bacterium]|nr:hypothetical protein [Sphingomonadales bacterium]